MVQAIWVGNAQATAQVVTATVTAVAAGGTLTATINGKTVTYTAVSADTTTTAAGNWQALLSGPAAPAEFTEITWGTSANAVTATATNPGTPFAGMPGGLVFSAGGGCTLSTANTQANVSPSDLANPQNWSRLGQAQLPQRGDDAILANTGVPILWNLNALAQVGLNSWTRWQSFTGSVGLPEANPNGYREYRQTYLQLASAVTALPVLLGQGNTGGGPSRERYDFQSYRYAADVIGAGGGADTYAVRLLGTNPFNTARVTGTSVGIATTPGEFANLAGASCDGGGLLDLGPAVSVSGTLTYISGQGTVQIGGAQASSSSPAVGGSGAPGTLNVWSASSVQVTGGGQTYPVVVVQDGSSLTWPATGTVTALTLARGSVFDKSGSLQPLTVGTLATDTSSVFLDPNNSVTFTGRVTCSGPIQSGPLQFGPNRQLQVF
jgi:hypothetical protein